MRCECSNLRSSITLLVAVVVSGILLTLSELAGGFVFLISESARSRRRMAATEIAALDPRET